MRALSTPRPSSTTSEPSTDEHESSLFLMVMDGWVASPCRAANTSLCLSRENAQEQGTDEDEDVGEGDEEEEEEVVEGGAEVGWDWAMININGNTDDGDDHVKGRGGVVRAWASLANCSCGLVTHRSSSSYTV